MRLKLRSKIMFLFPVVIFFDTKPCFSGGYPTPGVPLKTS